MIRMLLVVIIFDFHRTQVKGDMINSLGSSNTQIIEAMMQNITISNDIGLSVLKKNQDLEKNQGEALLKLIDAASSNGQIDVYA